MKMRKINKKNSGGSCFYHILERKKRLEVNTYSSHYPRKAFERALGKFLTAEYANKFSSQGRRPMVRRDDEN